jgi:hypothetical protein
MDGKENVGLPSVAFFTAVVLTMAVAKEGVSPRGGEAGLSVASPRSFLTAGFSLIYPSREVNNVLKIEQYE